MNGLATASTPKILAQKIGWQQQIIRKLNPPGMYIQKLEERRQYEIPCDNKMTNLWHDGKASVCVFSFEIGLPK